MVAVEGIDWEQVHLRYLASPPTDIFFDSISSFVKFSRPHNIPDSLPIQIMGMIVDCVSTTLVLKVRVP